MNNYQLKNDEVILFEGPVTVEQLKSEVKFTLTSKNMIFEKEKGIFKKKLKVIDIVPLENIKVYKEKVKVKSKKSNVMIQTTDKNITLSCSNFFEAKRIAEEIISIKTGSNIIKRNTKKIKKVITVANDTKKFIGAVTGLVVCVYHFFKNKD